MAGTKKKRKWTEAEKKAFARRMKKARAAKSGVKTKKRKSPKKKATTKRKTAAKKPTTRRKTTPTKTKGASMAKKKSKKSSGGKKVSRSRRRRGGGGKKDIVTSVKNAAIAIGGGLLAGMVANKMPIPNPVLKAASPAIAGAALLATIGRRNPMVAQMATGMMVLGGVAAIRAQFPNVPLLAGEEEVAYYPPEMLGYSPDDDEEYYGVEDFAGAEEYDGLPVESYVSPANL